MNTVKIKRKNNLISIITIPNDIDVKTVKNNNILDNVFTAVKDGKRISIDNGNVSKTESDFGKAEISLFHIC